jgi:hypothetical protein
VAVLRLHAASASHVTDAAYSCVREVYVPSSTKCPTSQRKRPNFYEKALFVKVDLATALWWTQRLSVPLALCFYPRSLGELILVGR